MPTPDASSGDDASPESDTDRQDSAYHHDAGEDGPADSAADTPETVDTGPGTDGDNEAGNDAFVDSGPDQPRPLRCRSDSDCPRAEPICLSPPGVCYDGVSVRCEDDEDCPPGWGQCLPDDLVCSG